MAVTRENVCKEQTYFSSWFQRAQAISFLISIVSRPMIVECILPERGGVELLMSRKIRSRGGGRGKVQHLEAHIQ